MLRDSELLVWRQYCYSNVKDLKVSRLQQKFQASESFYCITEEHLGLKVFVYFQDWFDGNKITIE